MKNIYKIIAVLLYIVPFSYPLSSTIIAGYSDPEMMLIGISVGFTVIFFTVIFLIIKLWLIPVFAKNFGVIYKKWLLFYVIVFQIYLGLVTYMIDALVISIISTILAVLLTIYLHKPVNENYKRLVYVSVGIGLFSISMSILAYIINNLLMNIRF
jgi:hypothetical protein